MQLYYFGSGRTAPLPPHAITNDRGVPVECSIEAAEWVTNPRNPRWQSPFRDLKQAALYVTIAADKAAECEAAAARSSQPLWAECAEDWRAWSAWWGRVAQLVTEPRQ
jgi:hypothetical protein